MLDPLHVVSFGAIEPGVKSGLVSSKPVSLTNWFAGKVEGGGLVVVVCLEEGGRRVCPSLAQPAERNIVTIPIRIIRIHTAIEGSVQ